MACYDYVVLGYVEIKRVIKFMLIWCTCVVTSVIRLFLFNYIISLNLNLVKSLSLKFVSIIRLIRMAC